MPAEESKTSGGRGWFNTTRWSMVRAAADSGSEAYRHALSDLCRIYWNPVHVYICSRGTDPDTARDLAQGFFTQLLDKRFLKDARQSRGRFRSFLLTCVKNYLANEWDKRQALKRGGGQQVVDLDADDSNEIHEPGLADAETPDRVFEREYARTLLRRVFAHLEDEAERAGKSKRFDLLQPFLTGEGKEKPYRDIARELGTSEGAIKVAVHDLRKKFAARLKDEVAETVESPEQIDEEIRFLFEALKP